MKKNIGTQEAHIRTIAGIVVLLFALFLVDNPSFRILLAAMAAILAGTAYMRSCPISTLLKRNTYEGSNQEIHSLDERKINETVSETEVSSESENGTSTSSTEVIK